MNDFRDMDVNKFGDGDGHVTPTLAIDFGAASKHHDDDGGGAKRDDTMVTQAYVVGVLTGFLDNLTRCLFMQLIPCHPT